MSVSDNQEIHIHLTEHSPVNEEGEEAKYVAVLIVRTCIIELNIQNWKKGRRLYWSCRWGWWVALSNGYNYSGMTHFIEEFKNPFAEKPFISETEENYGMLW
jgi:hypothetical protein